MADAVEEKPKLSFSFNKKVHSKTLQDSQLRHESTKEQVSVPDYVLSVSEDEIVSTAAAKSAKAELVIPLIVKNNWRLPSIASGSNVKSDLQATSLEKQAIEEILKDTETFKELNEKENDSNLVIPVFIRNKIPDGFETDDKVNVSLRAEESTLDDYEQVPIEEYGLAMLKGMGWKPNEGIGATNKKVIKPIETVLRPKGLGLGAGTKTTVAKGNKKDEEVGSIELGAFVRITDGPHKSCYGQVAGLDVDNSRVMITLTLNSQTVTVNELYVVAVSKQEYKKESKVINKAKYDEYKELSQSRKAEELASNRHASSHKRDKKHDHASSEDEKDVKKVKVEKQESSRRSTQSWVQPLLRVRFIDKSYKNGKYYNTKVIIEDVCNKSVCVCRTQSGHILEGICEQWLETLIPKEEPYVVMVVRGSYKGQLGRILDKDKRNYTAKVQLLQERDIVKLHYDAICQYCGRVSDFL